MSHSKSKKITSTREQPEVSDNVNQVLYYIYARESRINKGDSLRNQDYAAEDYIKYKHSKEENKGLKAVIVGSFYDHGVSGTFTLKERQKAIGLADLVRVAAIQRKVKCKKRVFVVKNTARFARNMEAYIDLERYINTKLKMEIEYVQIGGAYEETAQGKLAKNINIVVAQFEADNDSHQQKQAVKQNADKGRVPRNTTLFGFEWQKIGENEKVLKFVYKNKDTGVKDVETVLKMYEMVIEGSSKNEVYEYYAGQVSEDVSKKLKARVNRIMGGAGSKASLIYTGKYYDSEGNIIDCEIGDSIMEYETWEKVVNKWKGVSESRSRKLKNTKSRGINGFWLQDKMMSHQWFLKNPESDKKLYRNLRTGGKGIISYEQRGDKKVGIKGESIGRDFVNQKFYTNVLCNIGITMDGEKAMSLILEGRADDMNRAIKARIEVYKNKISDNDSIIRYKKEQQSSADEVHKAEIEEEIKHLIKENSNHRESILGLESERVDKKDFVACVLDVYRNLGHYWEEQSDEDKVDMIEQIFVKKFAYNKKQDEFVGLEINTKIFEWKESETIDI